MKSIAMALALASVACCAPIVYNEIVDGDLPDRDPMTLLTLGLGANTISGAFGENNILDTVDFDMFAFIVPVGTHIIRWCFNGEYQHCHVELVSSDRRYRTYGGLPLCRHTARPRPNN
jgi:hypothetical protein